MPAWMPGDYTFVLDIPPDFQRDVLAGRVAGHPAQRRRHAHEPGLHRQRLRPADRAAARSTNSSSATAAAPRSPVDLALRARFNPNLEQSWFGALMEIINNVTMLSIILTGAALIREREHGTIEHLLVMPVTPAEIMLAKVWSMGLVVLLAAAVALVFVVQGVLRVPIEGSVALFLAGAALHLFATTSMGIFMATLARSMPQFGMLLVLVLLPLQLLSGGSTPRESMPELVQDVMLAAPTTHFVVARPGHPLPRRRPRRGLAAVPRARRDRRGVLRHRPDPLSQDHRNDDMRQSTPSAPDLRKQYDCGPVRFSGHNDALYERHLTFDQVLPPGEASARDKFEAAARPSATYSRNAGSKPRRRIRRATPKESTILRWSTFWADWSRTTSRTCAWSQC